MSFFSFLNLTSIYLIYILPLSNKFFIYSFLNSCICVAVINVTYLFNNIFIIEGIIINDD